MDKPRVNPKKKRRPFYIAAAVLLLTLITLGLAQLDPAVPSIEGATAWLDTVARGPLVRKVGGAGTLVPVQVFNIPAVASGRVEEVYARPGTPVEPGTPLLRLSNPDVELQLLEAERQLTSARSALESLRATLQTETLNMEASLASARSQYNDAVRQDSVNQELLRRQLIAANEAAAARDKLEEARKRLDVETERLKLHRSTIESRLAAQEADVERLIQIVEFRKGVLKAMNVVAGTEGILQQLDFEIGQWVSAGTLLARVVKPDRLKAELRIPEVQAAEVEIGQVAHIDTRNGIVDGRVVRIDPSSENGTVGVDVELPPELPTGARPDLSVDGEIEIERLDDVLYIGRPQYGSANSRISLFKLEPDGEHAVRVVVQLGQSSVNEVVIESGLVEGDIVILTDMSEHGAHDRVRLR